MSMRGEASRAHVDGLGSNAMLYLVSAVGEGSHLPGIFDLGDGTKTSGRWGPQPSPIMGKTHYVWGRQYV